MRARLKSWLKVRFIAGFFVTVPAVATAGTVTKKPAMKRTLSQDLRRALMSSNS